MDGGNTAVSKREEKHIVLARRVVKNRTNLRGLAARIEALQNKIYGQPTEKRDDSLEKIEMPLANVLNGEMFYNEGEIFDACFNMLQAIEDSLF